MSNKTPIQRQTLRFSVPAGQDKMRLDQFLPVAAVELSRGVARKLIDLGSVHVNGRRVRKSSLLLGAGDRIEVNIDGLPLTPYVLAARDIVFSDKYLLVVNKPAGVDSQPTPSRYKGTMYAAVSDYLKNPYRPDLKPTVGMVQRLDRDTSGLMVFSIHPAAHKGLSNAFSERAVRKKYLAVVSGQVTEVEGEFHSLLARRRATNTMKSVDAGGVEAITRYRLIAALDTASLVEVEIPTGRSHQIRAHFSEAGHPLLGDARYGGPMQLGQLEIGRQMLHAGCLQFKHPQTGEALDFNCELPYDMKYVVAQLFQGIDIEFT